MISTSQREHLTYTLIGQTITIVATLIITWNYLLPGYTKIGETQAKAEQAITHYNEIRTRGFTYPQITSILGGMKEKEELLKIMQSTPSESEKALRNEGDGEYLNWLKNAINASEDDKKRLIQAKKKINSIIPTLSPISGSIDEENINLKEYIKFIEKRLLSDFNLGSNISLGIQGLVFGNETNGIPPNIGTFDLRIDFKTSNQKVKDLITFIQESGNPEILIQSGILSENKIPEIMSNPLITLEGFSLQDPLDVDENPEKENSGRASLRFYLRGGSKDDISFLRENLKLRKENLGADIEKTIAKCTELKDICTISKGLKELQSKYNEFVKFTSKEGALGTGVDVIYDLSQQVTTVRALESEFEGFNNKIGQ